MRLLCITDIHGNRNKFEAILNREKQPDWLIIGGDFTDFGPLSEARALLDLARLYCPNVLAVAGNCDSPEIDAMLHAQGVSLHRRGVAVDGIGFFGLSAMPPWRGNMYEFTEAELDQFLDESYQTVRDCEKHVLVSHPPPRDTAVDRNSSGAHVGSTAVRAWVERIKPILVICGHIHEARGTDQLSTVPIVNCGPCRNGYYAVAEIDQRVTITLHQL